MAYVYLMQFHSLTNMKINKKSISVLLMLSLSACSATYKKTKDKVDKDNVLIDGFLKSSQNSHYAKSFSMVQYHNDGVYIGMKPFGIKRGEDLPVNVEADGVNLYSAKKMSLNDIAKLITIATAIPVYISKNDMNKKSDTTDANKSNIIGDGDMFQKLNAVVSHSVPPMEQIAAYDQMPGMAVDYKGKLSTFLKLVSSYFGISWQYMDGVIYFTQQEVRTFTINTLPIKVSAQTATSLGLSIGSGGGDTSGGSSGGGSSGGGSSSSSSSGGDTSATSSNSSQAKLQMDIWSDIRNNLGVILQNNGSYNIAEGLSSVTVSTTSANMVNVKRYIDKLNEKLRQEITVNVAVYNLALNDDSDWNYSLTAMFSALKGRVSGSLAFLSGDAKSGMQGTTENNSAFILDMLNSQGKVSLLNSANLTTMSGQPVPLQVSNTRGYVSSIGTTVNNNVSQSDLSVSLINSGFGLNILPRILDDGKILLQYSVNMSSLAGKNNGFDEFIVDKQSVQLPNLNQRSFTQMNLLNNNRTLVVAGYKNSENSALDTGVGSPEFKLLGGKQSGKNKKEIIVICITPVALNLDLAGGN